MANAILLICPACSAKDFCSNCCNPLLSHLFHNNMCGNHSSYRCWNCDGDFMVPARAAQVAVHNKRQRDVDDDGEGDREGR